MKFNEIYWVRSDLRIHDNSVINIIREKPESCLLIWCPTKSYKRAKSLRKNFIDQNVNSFSQNVQKLGLNFLKSSLDIQDELVHLLKNQQIEKIYFTNEYAFEEISDEKKVVELCDRFTVEVVQFDQATLVAEKNLPFDISKMPFVFSDFRRKIEGNLMIRPAEEFKSNPVLVIEEAGEGQALSRLKEFIWDSNSISNYKNTRNGMMQFNDSSKLSSWLNIGALSPRKIFEEIKKYEREVVQNESTYWLFFELLWRDYFKFLSKKYGKSIFLENGILKPTNEKKKIVYDQELFHTWCQGKTDEPFVNANMKELLATGFMSNRGRQNVASFLINNLNLPWTWGAAFFEEQLIDYDPDINWGNWLYLSGKGTDPRARVFNIKKQANDYDQLGEYQKKWNKE